MRKILIVGAGQSGMHLAHGLLSHGYDVTVMTGNDPEEIRSSAPSVTQFSLPLARAEEERLRLDFYTSAPPIRGLHLSLYPPGTPDPVIVRGAFPDYATAVDRRIKQADWLEHFDTHDGKVIFHGCTVSDLQALVRMFDLVVVATGGGELGHLFPVIEDATPTQPRVITQLLADGIEPSPSGPEYAEVISCPLGRILIAPILSQHGPAHSVCVMDSPGGVLDGSHLRPSRGRPDATEVAAWITTILQQRFAHISPRIKNATPLDATAALVTTLHPHLRQPVAQPGPGRGHVLGLADAIVHTDPIAAQGWNLSSLCAATYLQCILEHREAPFTVEWMRATFAAAWQAGLGAAQRLSHTLGRMWDADAPAHLGEVIAAAAQHPEVANRFVGGLADPTDYETWLYDPAAARVYLTEVTHHPS